jgi:hypothetical protein
MTLAILIIAGLVLIFGFVIFFGAPYLPTLEPQKKAALELLDLEAGQTLIELGSGDGTMLLAAAQKGLNVIGYELNPILVIVSYIRTSTYRHRVKVIWGNYWVMQWPETDGIFTFLLDKYMKKLDKKIVQNYPDKKIKLVSHAFRIPGKKHSKEKAGVFLYEYNL